MRIADLAAFSAWSVRQLERRFTATVDRSPKLYGRIARLAQALDFEAHRSQRGWAEVAPAAGYADQAQPVRDCTELAGACRAAAWCWRWRAWQWMHSASRMVW